MERKHYAGINPGLQLVEKAGPLAKTGQGARDAAYLPLAGTWLQDRAHHLRPLLPATAAIVSVLL